MPVDYTLKGLVRGTVDTLRALAIGGQGQQLQAKYLPDYATLVAEGRVWRVQEVTATGSVIALPSTASLLTIGNNEPDDGLWYVVLAVTAFNSANAAAIDGFGLAGVLSQIPAVTGGLGVTMAQDLAKTVAKSMVGIRGGTYNGRAIFDTGVAVTDDDWFPIATGINSTAIASGTGATVFSWVNGLIVMPPKTLFGMVSTATSTSCTTRKGLIWAEVPRQWLLGA